MAVQPKAMEVDAVRCEAMRYGTVRLEFCWFLVMIGVNGENITQQSTG